jgi:hypothetical protein
MFASKDDIGTILFEFRFIEAILMKHLFGRFIHK